MIELLALLFAPASAPAPQPAKGCIVRTPAGHPVNMSAASSAGYATLQVSVGGGLELATVYKVSGKGEKLPVAVGFCGSSIVDHVGDVYPDLDPAKWSGTDCTVVSSGGKSAKFQYRPYDGNRATFIGAGWPWDGKISVDRGKESVNKAKVRITKLGGVSGLKATEYFYVLNGSASNVVLFDRLGKQEGAAAAICGYPKVVRRAASL